MPHAYRGLQLVEQAFSAKDGSQNSAGANDAEVASSGRNQTATLRDAYEAGHAQGWKDPARNIYEEVLRVCSSLRCDRSDDGTHEDDRPFDLNETYGRIVFAGHSRGGLLAYHAGVCCARGDAAHPPYRGALGIVGFGMPPPLSAPADPVERAVCAHAVLSVHHARDPVANGALLSWPSARDWDPQRLALGLTPAEERERAAKEKQKWERQRAARAVSSFGGKGSFWGAMGSFVQEAVAKVGDSTAELASDIDQYHSIGEYLRKILGGNGDLLGRDASGAPATIAANSDTAIPLVSSFVVEKRKRESQWVLVFPKPLTGETDEAGEPMVPCVSWTSRGAKRTDCRAKEEQLPKSTNKP